MKISKQLIKQLIGWCLFALVLFLWLSNFKVAKVRGGSMQPNVTDHEIVLIQKRKKPQRYDIVAFKQDNHLLVKRVIGIPNDTFIKSGNKILIGSSEAAYHFSFSLDLSDEVAATFSEKGVLKNEQYFVVGDATNISRDSREFGLVSNDYLLGVVLQL